MQDNGKLYVMIGAPGSGKSTFAEAHRNFNENEIIVSRDNIRLKMLKDDEDYFSHESLVFKQFVEEIDKCLSYGLSVFADATHLNRKSRAKLLHALTVKPSETIAIYCKTPLELCIKQNEGRRSIPRKYVPETALRNMYKNIQRPLYEEGFDEVWTIERDGLNE